MVIECKSFLHSLSTPDRCSGGLMELFLHISDRIRPLKPPCTFLAFLSYKDVICLCKHRKSAWGHRTQEILEAAGLHARTRVTLGPHARISTDLCLKDGSVQVLAQGTTGMGESLAPCAPMWGPALTHMPEAWVITGPVALYLLARTCASLYFMPRHRSAQYTMWRHKAPGMPWVPRGPTPPPHPAPRPVLTVLLHKAYVSKGHDLGSIKPRESPGKGNTSLLVLRWARVLMWEQVAACCPFCFGKIYFNPYSL